MLFAKSISHISKIGTLQDTDKILDILSKTLYSKTRHLKETDISYHIAWMKGPSRHLMSRSNPYTRINTPPRPVAALYTRCPSGPRVQSFSGGSAVSFGFYGPGPATSKKNSTRAPSLRHIHLHHHQLLPTNCFSLHPPSLLLAPYTERRHLCLVLLSRF